MDSGDDNHHDHKSESSVPMTMLMIITIMMIMGDRGGSTLQLKRSQSAYLSPVTGGSFVKSEYILKTHGHNDGDGDHNE